MKLFDVTLSIETGMLVYPGNPEVKVERVKKMPKDSSNVSQLMMGLHTGTHVDGENHVKHNAPGVDKIPLEKCYGKCQVLDLTHVPFGKGITTKDLEGEKISKDDIIVLKTKNSSTGYKKFKKDFVYLTEDGAAYLVQKKVKTIAIDYLSIQKFRTGYCASHCVILEKKIPIFEGLNLSKIKKGTYEFIGFPLKITGSDGAPARVVLLQK